MQKDNTALWKLSFLIILLFASFTLLTVAFSSVQVLGLEILIFLVLSLLVSILVIALSFKEIKSGYLFWLFLLEFLFAVIFYLVSGSFLAIAAVIINLIGVVFSLYLYWQTLYSPIAESHGEGEMPTLKEIKALTEAEEAVREIEAAKAMESASKNVNTTSNARYVGSIKSSTYHDRDCAYVRQIPSHYRIWYKDKKSAEKDGRTPHRCVK